MEASKDKILTWVAHLMKTVEHCHAANLELVQKLEATILRKAKLHSEIEVEQKLSSEMKAQKNVQLAQLNAAFQKNMEESKELEKQRRLIVAKIKSLREKREQTEKLSVLYRYAVSGVSMECHRRRNSAAVEKGDDASLQRSVNKALLQLVGLRQDLEKHCSTPDDICLSLCMARDIVEAMESGSDRGQMAHQYLVAIHGSFLGIEFSDDLFKFERSAAPIVKKLSPSVTGEVGEAEVGGVVAPGHVLLAVNGSSVERLALGKTKELIRSAPRPLRLRFAVPVTADGVEASMRLEDQFEVHTSLLAGIDENTTALARVARTATSADLGGVDDSPRAALAQHALEMVHDTAVLQMRRQEVLKAAAIPTLVRLRERFTAVLGGAGVVDGAD